MRILLDHCIPQSLRQEFPDDHTVETAIYRGWDDLNDANLLKKAESSFDALVTLDRGIPDQQNLQNWDVKVVLLSVTPAIPPHLRDCVPRAVRALETASHTRKLIVVEPEDIKV